MIHRPSRRSARVMHAREVRAPAGFRQQLYQHFVAAQRRPDVSALLFLAAHVEDRCAADGEGRDVEQERCLVGQGLGVEGLLVVVAQAEPAVLSGEADSGESAFVQSLLQFTGALPGRRSVALESHRVGGIEPRHVSRPTRPWPGSGILLDGLRVSGLSRSPAASNSSARHRRWPPAATCCSSVELVLGDCTARLSGCTGRRLRSCSASPRRE